MSQTIFGPFDDLYELHSPLDPAIDDELLVLDDPALVDHYLQTAIASPFNRDALVRALDDDLVSIGRGLNDQELVRLLADRVANGSLRLARAREATPAEPMGGAGGGAAAAAGAAMGAAAELLDARRARSSTPGVDARSTRSGRPSERADAALVRDWRIECGHHTVIGAREVIQRGASIQVVPPKGERRDVVRVWWRDQPLGSLPPSLTVRTPGRPDIEAPRLSGSGDTGTFGFDAEYLGDTDLQNIVQPSFWRSYQERTMYTVAPGPASINVEVFNPRRFKLEVSLPPLQSYKAGVKYEADDVRPSRLTKPKQLRERFETEDVTWRPSSLALHTRRTDTHPEPDFRERDEERSFGGVRLWRDDVATDSRAVVLLGKVLSFSESLRDLVTAIKTFAEYAPRVGWYADFNLQLFQGGLATEWYWKEHTDHRVYQFIDVNVAMKLFAIDFEFGVGVAAFSFKLQIFAQISGELAIEASLQRSSPDGAAGFTFPAVKGRIGGALGARVQAGIFFKFEAKAETAIETELAFGINQRNAPVSFDLRARWTGIECKVTGSAGPWGIAGTKTWKGRLVEPSRWIGLELPREEEFKPSFLSRDRIVIVLEEVITRGWDVRVIRSSGNVLGIGDQHWTPNQIATAIADRIEADPLALRDADTIDGLAHRIRGDLDRLGEHWGRDYVEEAAFLAYLDGTFRQRLREVHSPELLLLQQVAGAR